VKIRAESYCDCTVFDYTFLIKADNYHDTCMLSKYSVNNWKWSVSCIVIPASYKYISHTLDWKVCGFEVDLYEMDGQQILYFACSVFRYIDKLDPLLILLWCTHSYSFTH
jgi:hypothetical protein